MTREGVHTFIAGSQRTIRVFSSAASGSISILVVWRWTNEPDVVKIERQCQWGGHSQAKPNGGGKDEEELHLVVDFA